MVLGAAGRAVVATGYWFGFGFGFGYWFGFRSACAGVVPVAAGIVALMEAGLGLGPIVGNSPEVAVLGVTVLGVTALGVWGLGFWGLAFWGFVLGVRVLGVTGLGVTVTVLGLRV